jgi:multiple antibiotic resistance protein
MDSLAAHFVTVWVKMFFILTPFLTLTVFLSMTSRMEKARSNRIAAKTAAAVAVICLALYLFGNYIFILFGITLDAFRIGAGGILFLSAVSLVTGKFGKDGPADGNSGDIAVVPLAIPATVGPGTIGVLMVMGADSKLSAVSAATALGICAAAASLWVVLRLSAYIERIVGRDGVEIITKITGLFTSAIAAQVMFTGIKNFLLTK